MHDLSHLSVAILLAFPVYSLDFLWYNPDDCNIWCQDLPLNANDM